MSSGPTPHDISRDLLRRERRWRLFGFLAILISSATLIIAIKGLLVSTILGFVIAYLFSPIVDWLERRGLGRGLATVLPFALGGIVVGIGVSIVLPLIVDQATNLVERLPHYQQELTSLVSTIEHKYRAYWKVGQINPSKELAEWIAMKTADVSAALPDAVSHSFTVLMLAPFFAFFMLQDGNAISRSLLSFVPNPLFEIALNLRHQINDQLGGFIRARFLEAAIVGFVVWIGLFALNFPYTTILSIFAAATNLIPYLGPIIGAIPAILITLVSPEFAISEPGTNAATMLILVTSVYLVAQLIDVVFIIPLVVAKIVDLHPVTVVVMIIVGAEVGGILGMVISIPVASAIKLTFNALYSHLTHFRD
ncbi:MAG: AI-2E family transporter [Bdellovibrionales bacterium]|nr:AI-2E family transporter [Bdellovibrionales bacterium]